MCTLIAFWRSVPGYDIVLGMNRDESSMRPADPPAVVDGTPIIVAPRDRQAGGTWLGASGTGLAIALSNRRGRTSPSARSRGQLVQSLLAKTPSRSVDEVTRALQGALRTHATGTGGVGLCVHFAGGGTVSSTIMALSNADPGENVLLYADGSPCTTPYRDYHEI